MGVAIIKPSETTREQSITDIIQSVALEQTALAHILNAEGKKIQKALEPCAVFDFSTENHLKVYDFVYQGVISYTGLNEQGYAFVVFQLSDANSATTTNVYCFDVNTFIQVGDHYSQILLQGSQTLTETNANRIRNILTNSFPYIPVNVIGAMAGIPSLTQSEAVTATQLAIWNLINNFTMNHSNTNVMLLYNWYLQLPPLDIIIDPASVNLIGESIFAEGECAVKFTFNTTGKNIDQTPVVLSYTFDKEIEAEYGAVITESTSDGTTTVTITHLPQGANFSIIVSGEQSLPYDAYQYVDAQDLVGLFLQTNYMSSTCNYICRGNCNIDILKVNKSVIDMVNSISRLEIILQSKLALFDKCLCENKPEQQ